MDTKRDIDDLKKNGWQIEKIALKFEVNAATVYRWHKGITEPGKFIARKIAQLADLERSK